MTIEVEALKSEALRTTSQIIPQNVLNGMSSTQPPPEAGLVSAFSEILLNKLKVSNANDTVKRLSAMRGILDPVELSQNQLGLTVFTVGMSALSKMVSLVSQGLKQLISMQ